MTLVSQDSLAFSVTVPPPGEGIELYVTSTTRSVRLGVDVAEDGELEYLLEDATKSGSSESAASPPTACKDKTWTLSSSPGRLWDGEPVHYDVDTFPSYLNSTTVKNQVVASVNAWPSLYNNCGMVDDIDVAWVNAGDSDVGVSIDSTGSCYTSDPNFDNFSQIKFGALPTGVLGVTCRARQGGVAIGVDMRLKNGSMWTTHGASASCSNKYDLRSVVTHEAGHLWGLGDVADYESHPALTMRGAVGPDEKCTTFMRTLAKGDVLGMRAVY